MKYKVVATDLDGTLLHHKKWISKQNLESLSRFIDKGGILCFITGRSLNSSLRIANLFYKKTNRKINYIACLNGSIIYDYLNEKIVDENYIPSEIIEEIYETSKINKLGFGEYTKNGMINKVMQIYGYNILWIAIINIFNPTLRLKSIEILNTHDRTYKINIIRKFSKTKFNDFKNKVIKFKNDLEISNTSNWLYEITSKNINKGYAIKKISDLLSIPYDEFVCFGDSANDLPMFNLIKKSYISRNKYRHIFDSKQEFNPNIKQKNAIAYWLNQLIK